MKNMANVTAKVLRETEKALQLSVLYWSGRDMAAKEMIVWCPKTCCIVEKEQVTKVAEFILNKWADVLTKNRRTYIYYDFEVFKRVVWIR